MPTVGELLVADGVCTAEQVEEAVQNQVILGGRLGTNLIELGHIEEEILSRYLSRKHELPAMAGESIVPDPDSLDLMPAEAVDRLNIIPFIRENKRIQVLCTDPCNIKALDEVAFITGLRPDPIVVPEIRMWQLLRKHYGIERQLRFVALDTHDFMSKVLMEDPPQPGPVAGEDLISEESFAKLYHRRDGFPDVSIQNPAALPSEAMPLLSTKDFEEMQETDLGPPGKIERRVWQALSVEDGRRKEDREPVTPGHVPAETDSHEVDDTPLNFAEATRMLADVNDREAVARAVLRYARSVFKRFLLLTIHRGLALGWDAIGEDVDRWSIRSLMIPLDAPSIFQLVVNSRSHYLGGLPRTEVNVNFLRATGKQVPASVVLLPILIRGRVVNLLYGDNGHKAHCPSDIGELLILAQRISRSYEVLFERKRAAYLSSQAAKS